MQTLKFNRNYSNINKKHVISNYAHHKKCNNLLHGHKTKL